MFGSKKVRCPQCGSCMRKQGKSEMDEVEQIISKDYDKIAGRPGTKFTPMICPQCKFTYMAQKGDFR